MWQFRRITKIWGRIITGDAKKKNTIIFSYQWEGKMVKIKIINWHGGIDVRFGMRSRVTQTHEQNSLRSENTFSIAPRYFSCSRRFSTKPESSFSSGEFSLSKSNGFGVRESERRKARARGHTHALAVQRDAFYESRVQRDSCGTQYSQPKPQQLCNIRQNSFCPRSVIRSHLFTLFSALISCIFALSFNLTNLPKIRNVNCSINYFAASNGFPSTRLFFYKLE